MIIYHLIYKDNKLNIIIECFKNKPNNKKLLSIIDIYKTQEFYGQFILEKI
jgi:NADH:ubiquinone oxidoreductase subunit C